MSGVPDPQTMRDAPNASETILVKRFALKYRGASSAKWFSVYSCRAVQELAWSSTVASHLLPDRAVDRRGEKLARFPKIPYHTRQGRNVALCVAQVSDVWVAGRRVLEGGQLTTIDINDVLRKAGQWQSKLARQPDQWDANRQETAR